MPSPKSIKIKLTDRQRAQVRAVTGEDHTELKVERAALSRKTPLRARATPRQIGPKGPLTP